MPFVLKDRVRETTTTTGTGSITLAGAVPGYQSFVAIGNGNTTCYAIVDRGTGAWETGIGTWSTGGTLARSVLQSSNGNALVDFPVGTKDVFVSYLSSQAFGLNQTLGIANGGTGATTLTGIVKGNGTSAFSAAVAGTDFPGLASANTFTAAQTFRAANAVRSEAAATQDAIVLAGRAGGTSSFAVTLTPTTLGASRTITLPDATTTMVGTDVTQTLSAKTITGLRETRVAMGASDIDISAGNYFTRTISGTTTLTVSNVPAAGTAASFILDLTNGGSATINWWTGVRWAGGTAPTLTTSGRDVLGFFTHDGGTNWTGLLLGRDVK